MRRHACQYTTDLARLIGDGDAAPMPACRRLLAAALKIGIRLNLHRRLKCRRDRR